MGIKLVPVLVEAIKELKKDNEDMRLEINKIKGFMQ